VGLCCLGIGIIFAVVIKKMDDELDLPEM